MRYHLLACDYDGTIAKDGVVAPETTAALRRVSESGRILALVTGRELTDLLRVFPDLAVFDWVVAENGGLLFKPSTREEQPLAPEPSEALVGLLRQRGVVPLSVGRTLIATWEPQETVVLEAIRELGLELQVTFNKGAVMVLPASVNKRSGLEALLKKIGLSAHNCVGIGDAENDHAFLGICEYSVAVSNALPAVKQSVDWVTTADHGAGVQQLIDRLLEDDLQSPDMQPERLRVAFGVLDDGTSLSIPACGPVGLIAGGSGSGKTTATSALLEQLAARDYQLCIIDPEGDYESFPSAIVVGSAERPPEIEQLLAILEQPQSHVVANLLAVRVGDRPHFFLELLTSLQHMRAKTGRPHWIAVDEAHHVLDAAFEPMVLALPLEMASMLFVTVQPQRLHASLLERLDFAMMVGPEGQAAIVALAEAMAIETPEVTTEPDRMGQVLYWERASNSVRRVTLKAGASMQRRHRRKYARGELGPDKSFYFRGPEGKLNLRAQNLMVFNDIGAGVDDETWKFHLNRGEYSGWIREAIKDEALALKVAEVEKSPDLSALESRARIRELIEEIYTAPA